MSRLTRRLAIGLAVSVGLNLFLLGMFSVRLLHPARTPHGDRGGHLLFHAEEAFEGDRGRARRVMREHKKELRGHFRATREARHDVRAALEAEPFEPQRLEQSLGALRDRTRSSQEVLHRALVGLATEATPEERRRLAGFADHPRASRWRPGRGPGRTE